MFISIPKKIINKFEVIRKLVEACVKPTVSALKLIYKEDWKGLSGVERECLACAIFDCPQTHPLGPLPFYLTTYKRNAIERGGNYSPLFKERAIASKVQQWETKSRL